MAQRLIDADVVIKHIEEYWEMVKRGKPSRGMTAVMQSIKTIVNSLQTVDAEPHWIPCSERMPNDDKDYLVTDGESMAVGYYRTDAKAWDNVNFGWLEHREETCGLKPVVAWMPLPEPYEVKE